MLCILVMVIWAFCAVLQSCSITADDAMPDVVMIGVPFTGDMDNAYGYVSWAVRQPSEWKEAE